MHQEILKKLQATQLEILRVFHEYCEKNSLKYYLIGGALLGSERYGTFIPWDDDIDVAMFRDDYENLKILWEHNSLDGYFLQHNKSDFNFARGITKLRLNDTELIEATSQNIDMHNGIYIDIFPIDYVKHNDGFSMRVRGKLINRLLSLRSIKSGYNNGNYIILKKLIKTLCPITNYQIDNLIDYLSIKENNKTKKYAILWVHNYGWKKQIHDFDTFGAGGKCIFEGYEFDAPLDKHAFLKKVFGDNYLYEPPPEKRITPHNYVQITFKE